MFNIIKQTLLYYQSYIILNNLVIKYIYIYI